MTKKLYRSQTDRMIGGVCGGLGEYLDIDPTLVRLAFIAFTLFGGSGLLVYFICLLVIPIEQVRESSTSSTEPIEPDQVE